ncbi:hypothetical protein AB6A40_009338 [Gnathostoma spinigerum]|uniref:Mitochondrial ribosomal protein L41 n=1 Tax=Gnathostoma spinigerum TaxID=75299 RepID=A0ABD6EWT9_9BILA
MISSISFMPCRNVRSLHAAFFRPPWPFVKTGARGQRKIGPFVVEKHKYPGQNREFPELSPKFQKLNPPQLRNYTEVQPIGYIHPVTGKHVTVPEMVPELVVPDLTAFKLRPYVSFKVDPEIEKRRQSYAQKVKEKGSEEVADLYVLEDQRWPPPKITAKTLFDLYYAPVVRQMYKDGKYDEDDEESSGGEGK